MTRSRLLAPLAVFAPLLISSVALAAGAPVPPAPDRWVTDTAGFLSAPTRTELESRLRSFEQQEKHQVLLWIGRTTGGVSVEDWAARAFAAWRVGRKGIDDGVVVFVFADDREIRIEVGYGLEGVLPDVRAARIIRDVMAPRLRSGDRDGAARAGIDAIVATLTGSDDSEPPTIPALGWVGMALAGIVGIILLAFFITHPDLALLFLMTLNSNRSRGRGGWSGGMGGGGWGGGFSGGGGRSGGGGATGSW